MFYVILFVVLFIISRIIYKSKLKKDKYQFGEIEFYSFLTTILTILIIAIPLNINLSKIVETKPVLTKSENIILQKYKQKEEYYSVYKATGGKNDNEERYYYSTSVDGILVLGYKPVGYSYIRHDDNQRVETYIDKIVNPNIKFWLFVDKTIGEKYIFYVKDDNIDLK